MKMKNFGSLIAELRRERGMSQEEFAAAIGVKKQTICHYEHNRRKPGYETLEAIADVFNVPIGFFLSEEEQRKKLGRIYRTYNIAEEKVVSYEDCDEDVWELRESLRRNPDMRVLFSTAKDATPKQLRQAVAILNALKENDEHGK